MFDQISPQNYDERNEILYDYSIASHISEDKMNNY